MTERSPWFRRHPQATMVGLVLGLCVLLDVLTANLYRLVWGFPWGSVERERAVESTYRKPAEFYHHGLAPNMVVDNAVWGLTLYHVRTNSLGFKDKTVREVSRVPKTRRRIVFIGDSYTEGVGVNYDETFVGRIDAELGGGDGNRSPQRGCVLLFPVHSLEEDQASPGG